MKKRIFCIALSLLMLSSALSVSAFAVDSEESTPTNYLYIENYMQFYENQDYYLNLVDTENYCLYINVPDEYIELERTRILSEASSVQSLRPNTAARGLSAPTIEWNIAQKGTYAFDVDTDSSPVYTNRYFTGVTSYRVSVLNTSNVKPGVAYFYGNNSRPRTIDLSSAGSVIKNFNVSTTTTPFYICFTAPAYLVGNVKENA